MLPSMTIGSSGGSPGAGASAGAALGPAVDHLPTLMRLENDRAVEAYISHLDGLGLEYLESRNPQELHKGALDRECVRSIWKMACYTFFPQCSKVRITEQVTLVQQSLQSAQAEAGESRATGEASASTRAHTHDDEEEEEEAYLRPCAGTCHEYVNACQVQCCDEGVQCVFTHTAATIGGGGSTNLLQLQNQQSGRRKQVKGYVGL